MALKLITPPATAITTLAEAKAHLRVDHSTDDTLIASLIAAAEGVLDGPDGKLQRALLTQTWELHLDEFPDGDLIRVPLPPLASVTSIKYTDDAGVEQTVSSADYAVDIVSRPGWIAPSVDVSWPSPMETLNAVRVRFVCGYGIAADVPGPIRQALLLLIGHLYQYREAVAEGSHMELPMSVDWLIQPYRWIAV